MSLVPPGRLAENTENYETNYTSKIESFAVSSVQNRELMKVTNYTSKIESFAVSSVQNRELMKVIILLETFIQYVGLS